MTVKHLTDRWTVRYNMRHDTFEIESNIKSEHQIDIVTDFLLNHVGTEEDDTLPNIQDVYTISLTINADDEFTCAHDCGNTDLRNGILIHVVNLCKRDLKQ